MSRIRSVVLVSILIAAAVAIPPTPAGALGSPLEQTDAFLAAMSRGDAAAALALLDEAAVYQGLFVCAPRECVGQEAIAAALEFEIDDTTEHLLWSDSRDETSTGAQAAGEMRCRSLAATASRVVYTLRAEVGPGGITTLRLSPDARDFETSRVLANLAAVRDLMDEARIAGVDGPVTFGSTLPP